MLDSIPCTAGVHSNVSCGFNAGVLSAVSNVLANEEIFLEDSSITLSTSSIVLRFFFLGISADGVCFLKVTLTAKVFNVLADILSEVDDLVEADEGEEHAAMECTAESFSSFVPSKPASI